MAPGTRGGYRKGGFRNKGSFNRSNRNSNNNNNNNNRKDKDKPRKGLNDYIYYIGSAKQASDCTVITQYLINHIQQTYPNGNDIATALRNKSHFNFSHLMPTLQRSVAGEREIKIRENKQFDLLYEAEIKAFVSRKNTYAENTTKAYAFIWSHCNKGLQNKLKSRHDFESSIEQQPIALLMAIEEHSMTYQENKYDASLVLDALKNLINLRQRNDEDLVDYTRRFKAARDVFLTHYEKDATYIQFPKLAQLNDQMTSDERETALKEASDRLLSYLYLDNADKTKYGTLLSGMATQHSLGQDQYPKSITKAQDVLSNHRHDKRKGRDGDDPNQRGGKRRFQKQPPQTDDDKTKSLVESMTFAQMEGSCYCCGKKGHLSSNCRFNKRPKDQWAIHKTPEIKQAQHLHDTQVTNQGAPQGVAQGQQHHQGQLVPASATPIFHQPAQQASQHAQQQQQLPPPPTNQQPSPMNWLD